MDWPTARCCLSTTHRPGCYLPGRAARVWRSATLLAAVLAWALVLAGCATPKSFTLPSAPPGALPCFVPIPQRDLLIGVAMSGGGSRAALFGAASLEALGTVQSGNGRSVLEQVAYLSSVSGGSIAASYYALKKPARSVSVLTPEGTMSPAYRAFFNQYRDAVSQSFGNSVFWRQIGKFAGSIRRWGRSP